MKKNSFTLLEAIFAISILTLTISGSFALISRLLSFSPQVQSKLIASYLAQEGIEIIRNIRDTNWVQGEENWLKNLSTTTSYYLDHKSQKFPDDAPCNNDFLFLSTTTDDYYNCRGQGTKTKFQRKIKISEPATADCPAGNCVSIEVEVSWQEKGQTQSVKVIEHLYNWK